MSDPIGDLLNFFGTIYDLLFGLASTVHPLLGVFIASLLGNLVLFFPVPYLLIVFSIVQNNPGIGLLRIAVVGALGASIGKFASYAIGYGTASRISQKYRARFESLRKILGGSAFVVAYLFAALPLPDDVVFIPLGVLHYNPAKTFIALYAGKFTLTYVIAAFGRVFGGLLDFLLGGGWVGTVISIAFLVVVTVAIIKVDWVKVLENRSQIPILSQAVSAFYKYAGYPLLRLIKRRPKHEGDSEQEGTKERD